MGFEYEVDVEVTDKAATILSEHADDMKALSSEIGSATPPKAGVCGESVGPTFTAMTAAWSKAFTTLNGEMSALSSAVKGSTKMYLETEREVTRGFGKFAS